MDLGLRCCALEVGSAREGKGRGGGRERKEDGEDPTRFSSKDHLRDLGVREMLLSEALPKACDRIKFLDSYNLGARSTTTKRKAESASSRRVTTLDFFSTISYLFLPFPINHPPDHFLQDPLVLPFTNPNLHSTLLDPLRSSPATKRSNPPTSPPGRPQPKPS